MFPSLSVIGSQVAPPEVHFAYSNCTCTLLACAVPTFRRRQYTLFSNCVGLPLLKTFTFAFHSDVPPLLMKRSTEDQSGLGTPMYGRDIHQSTPQVRKVTSAPYGVPTGCSPTAYQASIVVLCSMEFVPYKSIAALIVPFLNVRKIFSS